jgi:hypothetical protein
LCSQEATWEESSGQECDFNDKAFGAPSFGSLWAISYDTLGGRRYGLIIINDYSIYTWVFLLKSKDETYKYFSKFAK